MSPQPWLASYGAIPAHIDPDSHPSIVHLLCAAMQRYAHRPAFTCLGQTLTYAHVDQQSRAFAAYLQNVLRVRKGDRIAVMCPNLMAFPIAMLGIARAGCVQVNVNPLYTPRELEHQLLDAGARVMVIYAGSTATLAAIQDRVELHSIITVAPGDGIAADLPGPQVDAHLHTTTSFARALAEGATLPFAPPVLEGSDLLFLQYTGGTTGLSKGAMLTHRNLVANVEQFKAFVPDALRPAQEVVVTAIPLYHIFALMVNLISYFAVGARNWLVPNPRDLDALIHVLNAARPSVFMGVNTLYAGLAAHPGTQGVDFSNLRLLDDQGHPAPLGQPGEVCVKGPQVMGGYWQQPEANAAAFTPDGYFRTGDIGQLDECGFLKIVDRKKDMVIVSGFNVFPNEVEAVATACLGVLECACIGVPDEKTGEALRLYVVRAAGTAPPVDADHIAAHCRAALTAYKVPRQIVFVEALPKSSVGKILRRELRDMA
ncbi:long-chain acyl-CoA synthetase [Acidovorax sp. 107]|uniref:AMP-binding protein n=1 Tax=Acidovorax sp. 107 TaxID=2135638 RepID=UPI000D382E7E|nr:AMP-binding protein [Acidovorax sp. 107]PUA98133.1 long-chain acyl-CoA synthetase [Acidovorax sp. 107]